MLSLDRRQDVSRLLLSATFAALLPFSAGTVLAASTLNNGTGHVYVLSNQPNGNSIVVFRRHADGTLKSVGSFATGGNGAGSGPDPLGSQNPVVLSGGGHLLFAVNAGSNTITAFRVSGDNLIPLNTVPSGGTLPVSLTVRHGLVYVLNAGGMPNISGFTIDPKTDELVPLRHSTQPLPGGSSSAPAEVSFSSKGHALMVTETATNKIDTFIVKADGTPQPGVAFPSSEATPFGFAFQRGTRVAVVSDAGGGVSGASALSSYKLKKGGSLVGVSPGVGDTQTAACWVVVTKDGGFAYTSNTGSGTISSYTVSAGGKLALLDVTAGDVALPVDMGLSRDGFLYVRDANEGTVAGFHIRSDGSLKQVTTAAGLPDGAAGLAAR
ncbi:MAG TPA: beta-propeller fold lactonase family protein [Rhizomicrobium sp.]|jgi:6-phosphogluconolactonase (cycloisomerase 2 family)|nr:beta-propeller fold lactonase family protein [Rhizomicrobium sp.]